MPLATGTEYTFEWASSPPLPVPPPRACVNDAATRGLCAAVDGVAANELVDTAQTWTAAADKRGSCCRTEPAGAQLLERSGGRAVTDGGSSTVEPVLLLPTVAVVVL